MEKNAVRTKNIKRNATIGTIIFNTIIVSLLILILKNQFLGYFVFLAGVIFMAIIEAIIALIGRNANPPDSTHMSDGMFTGLLISGVIISLMSILPGFIKMMSGPMPLF